MKKFRVGHEHRGHAWTAGSVTMVTALQACPGLDGGDLLAWTFRCDLMSGQLRWSGETCVRGCLSSADQSSIPGGLFSCRRGGPHTRRSPESPASMAVPDRPGITWPCPPPTVTVKANKAGPARTGCTFLCAQ
jgi:hypothetical protein